MTRGSLAVPFYLIETALGVGFALVWGFLALVIIGDRLFEARNSRRQFPNNLRFDPSDTTSRPVPRLPRRRGRRALAALR